MQEFEQEAKHQLLHIGDEGLQAILAHTAVTLPPEDADAMLKAIEESGE